MSTAAEILALQAQATPVINRISEALSDFLSRQSRPAFRITPKAVHGKRGRRARRQAFYSRQRTARTLTRLLRCMPNDLAEIRRAQLDMLVCGTGVVRVSEAGLQRVEPSTMFYGFDGQEVTPPDGSPRDAEIAAVRRSRMMTAQELAALTGTHPLFYPQ